MNAGPHVLVQLSDLHIVRPGERVDGRVDTAAALQAALRAIRRLPVAPMALLISGDLTEHGHPDEYRHLGELLAAWQGRVIVLPGNHDDPAALRRSCASTGLRCCSPEGAPDDVLELAGLRLVCLDSVVPGQPHGRLTPAQLGWLQTTLAEGAGRPTLIALHHPPFASHVAAMDEIGLVDGADELARCVARHPEVERIVCGHLHRAVQVRFAGTLAVSAPAPAHQLHPDFAPRAAPGYVLEPGGFLVHVWGNGQPLATHVLSSRRRSGPHYPGA